MRVYEHNLIDLQTWIKERRILGSMLKDPIIARQLCADLSPAAFADEKHRLVFHAIYRVVGRRPLSLQNVAEELASSQTLFKSQTEGLAFLEWLVTRHAID